MAAPSSISGRCARRLRLPRIKSEFDLTTTARAILPRTYATMYQYSLFHLCASRLASFLSACLVSRPAIPSTEYTSGVKSRRLSRHGAKCFAFLSFSHLLRTFSGSWLRVVLHRLWNKQKSNQNSPPMTSNSSPSTGPRILRPRPPMLWGVQCERH